MFLLAVFFLTLGACYEIFWMFGKLEPVMIAAVHSLARRLVDLFSHPQSTPIPIRIAVSATSGAAPVHAPPTNYLESMSPEEMERFLTETGD